MLLALVPDVDDAYVLAAVTRGELAPALRRAVLKRAFAEEDGGTLSEANSKVLQTLSRDDDCAISYEADHILAARGTIIEASADAPEHTLFVLCKLAQGPATALLSVWVDPVRYVETLREEEEHDAFIDERGRLTADNPPPRGTRRSGAAALPPSVPFSRNGEYACQGARCTSETGSDQTRCEHSFLLVPSPGGYRLRGARGRCVSQYACPC